jgi:proteasome accessory factor C
MNYWLVAIEISDNDMQHTIEHKNTVQDVFGFAKNGENTFKIDLYLSLRAYVLLKEEYPNTIPYLKFDRKKVQYRLVVAVNNLAPVVRFIKGLGDEIIVNSLG